MSDRVATVSRLLFRKVGHTRKTYTPEMIKRVSKSDACTSGTRANLKHVAMNKVDLAPLYSASTDGHGTLSPILNPA